MGASSGTTISWQLSSTPFSSCTPRGVEWVERLPPIPTCGRVDSRYAKIRRRGTKIGTLSANWGVTPCRSVVFGFCRSGGRYCDVPQLNNSGIKGVRNTTIMCEINLPWRWRQQGPVQWWYVHTSVQCHIPVTVLMSTACAAWFSVKFAPGAPRSRYDAANIITTLVSRTHTAISSWVSTAIGRPARRSGVKIPTW